MEVQSGGMQLPHHVLVTPGRLSLVPNLTGGRALMSWKPHAEGVRDSLFQQAIEFCFMHDDVSVVARDYPPRIWSRNASAAVELLSTPFSFW